MKHKKTTILAVSLLAAVFAVSGITLAFLTDSTEEIVNTFTPTSVPIDVVEDFENNVKENVKIQNTSTTENDTAAYIRVAVVKNWIDSNGDVVYLETDPEGYTQTKEGDYFKLTDANRKVNNWYYHTDGYYYFLKPVEPQGSTDTLISQWKIEYPTGAEYTLQVEILAQSVQSVPEEAIEDLWNIDVTVDGDGTITAIVPKSN